MDAPIAGGTAEAPPRHSRGDSTSRSSARAEKYGVDILRVRENKGWPGVTSIPEAPKHVLGIINPRGDIVPVVDLRRRFGLDRRNPDASTVLVMVSAAACQSGGMVGICVDAVSDVHAFADNVIKETPDGGNGGAESYVSGVAARDAKVLMLLDIDRIIGTGLPNAVAGH